MSKSTVRPLIVHIVHRFGVGGLENGLVNLINKLPYELARHCVLSLTTVDAAFRDRVMAANVEFVELRKPPGQTAWILAAVYRELRSRRPAIVHTRNLAALECQLAAALARVPVRVHGEHGWDINDLHGANPRFAMLRRLLKPLVHHQVALSGRTGDYLRETVGVPAERISELCNGVDVERFSPPAPTPGVDAVDEVFPRWHVESGFVVGTVGRLARVKNQRLLLDAFLLLKSRNPSFNRHARLVIIGDGPDSGMLKTCVRDAGAADSVTFAGECSDVPFWLRTMDLFCLPSLAEGISNSILEAMACGRPVVATDVGGNAELIRTGLTGILLPTVSVAALADVIEMYFKDRGLCFRHGREGRTRAVQMFSIENMVSAYASLYTRLLALPSTSKHSLENRSCAG